MLAQNLFQGVPGDGLGAHIQQGCPAHSGVPFCHQNHVSDLGGAQLRGRPLRGAVSTVPVASTRLQVLEMVAKLQSNLAASDFLETPAFRADKIQARSTGVRYFRFLWVDSVLADDSVTEVAIMA